MSHNDVMNWLRSDTAYGILTLIVTVITVITGIKVGRIIKNTALYSIYILIAVLFEAGRDLFNYWRTGTNHLDNEWLFLTSLAACAITVFVKSLPSNGDSHCE
jgi:hypothetical protein